MQFDKGQVTTCPYVMHIIVPSCRIVRNVLENIFIRIGIPNDMIVKR